MIRELETKRLRLRELQLGDAPAIFLLRSSAEVNRYIDREPPTEIAEANAFIEKIQKGVSAGGSFYWAITFKDSNELVGTICIWNLSEDRKTGELGYELLPAMQRKGIMQEAIERVIEFAEQDEQMKRLEAYTHKDNLSSTKLLLKYNFIMDTNKVDEINPDNNIYFLSLPTSY